MYTFRSNSWCYLNIFGRPLHPRRSSALPSADCFHSASVLVSTQRSKYSKAEIYLLETHRNKHIPIGSYRPTVSIPIGSMYDIYIYANNWGLWMVNVTIYSIHGSYGIGCRHCNQTTTNSPSDPPRNIWLLRLPPRRKTPDPGDKVARCKWTLFTPQDLRGLPSTYCEEPPRTYPLVN